MSGSGVADKFTEGSRVSIPDVVAGGTVKSRKVGARRGGLAQTGSSQMPVDFRSCSEAGFGAGHQGIPFDLCRSHFLPAPKLPIGVPTPVVPLPLWVGRVRLAT